MPATTEKKLGWIQSLIELLSLNWEEVQYHYIQYLGANNIEMRWIFSIIKKLWDTDKDTQNYHNHILHTQQGSFKMTLPDR